MRRNQRAIIGTKASTPLSAVREALGTTSFEACECCACVSEAPYGAYQLCPHCGSMGVWHTPPDPMTCQTLLALCHRHDIAPDWARDALRLDLAALAAPDLARTTAPDDIVRKIHALVSRPHRIRYAWLCAEPRTNAKWSVITPGGTYATVAAAAAANKLTYQTAYRRAVNGSFGWSAKPL